MRKRVTIKDVAETCGISIRTVSRVINHDPNVKKETRERIQAVIDELGFEANLIARRLKEKSSNQIVVFIDRHDEQYWSTFHNEIIQELYRETRAKGYRMVISASSADSFEEDENDGFFIIKNGFCDGAIMFDSKYGDKRIEYLKKHELPFVIIGKDMVHADTPFVDLDNEQAGYLGASYLYERGYQHVAFLLGNEDFLVNQERAQGFRRFCEEKQLEPAIYYGISDMKAAYERTKQLLEEDAAISLFISGDERALGVYRAVQEKGLRIGQDLAVLGIDNVKMGAYMYPPLTTIDQPKKQFSQSVLEILFQRLGETGTAPHRRLIEPAIVERESV
ncbi:LacI family DNA-binding transcriptional regulator [Marinicrinis sediminis]|uniref:LacI family DNA-binding transcriptional regulator n=1 Tax=Marinicrinis sediminis TaxID=1652465 RepID=A0ABW5R9E5_9BACL